LSCHSKSDMKISFVRSNKKTCQTESKLLKGDQRKKNPKILGNYLIHYNLVSKYTIVKRTKTLYLKFSTEKYLSNYEEE
jgi:hypothetical protein